MRDWTLRAPTARAPGAAHSTSIIHQQQCTVPADQFLCVLSPLIPLYSPAVRAHGYRPGTGGGGLSAGMGLTVQQQRLLTRSVKAAGATQASTTDLPPRCAESGLKPR